MAQASSCCWVTIGPLVVASTTPGEKAPSATGEAVKADYLRPIGGRQAVARPAGPLSHDTRCKPAPDPSQGVRTTAGSLAFPRRVPSERDSEHPRRVLDATRPLPATLENQDSRVRKGTEWVGLP